MTLPTQIQINEFLTSLKPAINKIAEQFKVASAEIWRVGILKQYVDGVLMLAFGLILLGIIICVIIKFKKIIEIFEEPVILIIMFLFPAIAGMIALIYFGLLHIVVPQYTLIKEIISLIGS